MIGLAICGIVAMVSVYALLNIAVVTGVLPTTGLPLPFISYGGSSLVWNMAGIGILLGVARSAAAGIKAPTRAGSLVKERR